MINMGIYGKILGVQDDEQLYISKLSGWMKLSKYIKVNYKYVLPTSEPMKFQRYTNTKLVCSNKDRSSAHRGRQWIVS